MGPRKKRAKRAQVICKACGEGVILIKSSSGISFVANTSVQQIQGDQDGHTPADLIGKVWQLVFTLHEVTCQPEGEGPKIVLPASPKVNGGGHGDG